MIVYFRLFAGFTSFISKRWRSQRVWMSPPGAFESRLPAPTASWPMAGSFMLAPGRWRTRSRLHQRRNARVRIGRQIDEDRQQQEADRDDQREHDTDREHHRTDARAERADRLEGAPEAVSQVEAEQRHHRD